MNIHTPPIIGTSYVEPGHIHLRKNLGFSPLYVCECVPQKAKYRANIRLLITLSQALLCSTHTTVPVAYQTRKFSPAMQISIKVLLLFISLKIYYYQSQ